MRTYAHELEAGKKYFVEVHGWVMLSGVDSGQYRLEVIDRGGIFEKIIRFHKPRGRKILATHLSSSVYFLEDESRDLNYIQLLRVED